ncbi:MAG: transcriptional repressor [Methyloprofundus sp.]|nr:transcriptional repressor [Methyloprofundus sp.]MDT8425588.1 transcriptional repressor [Methyloprofundus sp.]
MSEAIDSKTIQQAHNHKSCMQHALKSAEQICTKKGVRLTVIRKRILELICTGHKAIGAYELLDLFKLEDPKAKPVTIYRALDFLMEAGLVHKIESLNAFIGCLQAEKQHKSVILICDNCKNAYELDATAVYDSLFALSESMQFKPKCLTLELHGLCASCS